MYVCIVVIIAAASTTYTAGKTFPLDSCLVGTVLGCLVNYNT